MALDVLRSFVQCLDSAQQHSTAEAYQHLSSKLLLAFREALLQKPVNSMEEAAALVDALVSQPHWRPEDYQALADLGTMQAVQALGGLPLLLQQVQADTLVDASSQQVPAEQATETQGFDSQ